MGEPREVDEQQRILLFWWMLELFSPQQVPKLTLRSTRPVDRQVIEWSPEPSGAPLPWETLAPPKPLNGTRRVWQHTVYLGVYEMEATYESLHRVFGDDTDAYDERPGGLSACAGLLVDQDGRLVAKSAVLSSALWAVARIHDPGPENPHWAEGFEQAQDEFADAADDYEGDRREKSSEEQAPVLDTASLRGLLKVAHECAGIEGFDVLATHRLVIQTVAISARRAVDSAANDFLNSFYLDDLTAVRSRVAAQAAGPALAAYLTGDASLKVDDRVDVVTAPRTVDVAASIDRLPLGRWPSKPQHALALSQQFAVNQALNDLALTRGLMGVNGPPGTGKTTMVRDILAGNVVERARRLAALAKPEDAFTTTTHRWTANDGHPRRVRQLRPNLTGFEMVVASANNAAVENVTIEIPAQKAIEDPWRGTANYFADIASEVLRAGNGEGGPGEVDPPEAWGLVAARLGNKRNRTSFRDAFWFDKTDPRTKESIDTTLRMQTRLKQWAAGTVSHNSWARARDDFARAEQRVVTLADARRQAQRRLRQLPVVTDRRQELTDRLEQLRRDRQQVAGDLDDHLPVEQQAQADQARAAGQYERHLAVKPDVLETVLTFGRTLREWRALLAPLVDALGAAEQHQRDVDAHAQSLLGRARQTEIDLSHTQTDLLSVQEEGARLRVACEQDRHQYGDGYPDDNWVGKRRELHAPWLDAELDTARSELFLAALQLHQDFLANTAEDMLPGLRAAGDVIAGTCPHGLEPEKRRAAWQLFFLTVPLVSTTFASIGRMFGDIGPEAIGWLLIDEAGQASPQYAVGAIWRAQRVVAVGDPLQLQPVVTIPNKAQRDIAATYHVSPTWIPPRASVQTLADRVSPYGTTLRQGEQDVWVSAPLRVHRRCDDPMFSLCNDIAYNGIMVNGVHRTLDDPTKPDRFDAPEGPVVAPSYWADEPAHTAGTHLQENQIARLERALAYLAKHDIPASDVIAISPFRAVADRLATLQASYPGLKAGTIHTAQGREAPVVVLVLGGDPSSPGAKSWAASSVNLVNVAASRAQRRLYVIGDRAAWAQHNYFHQLSNALQ